MCFRSGPCLFLTFPVSRTISGSSRNSGHTGSSVHGLALAASSPLGRVCQTGAQVDVLGQGAYLPPAAPHGVGERRVVPPLALPRCCPLSAHCLTDAWLERAGDGGEGGGRVPRFCVPLEGLAPEPEPPRFTARRGSRTLPLDTRTAGGLPGTLPWTRWGPLGREFDPRGEGQARQFPGVLETVLPDLSLYSPRSSHGRLICNAH